MVPLPPLVSFRAVIRLESANLIAAVGYLAGAVSEWRTQVQLINQNVCPPLFIPGEYRLQFLKSLERIRDASKAMDMVASSAAADRAFDDCLGWFSVDRRYGAFDLQKVISHADRVVHAFMDEMRARLVFVMPSKHAAFYDQPFPFGEAVEEAFPSIAYDVAEAAKCRSLGRWTACVMHVMRALETGLGALAIHFGLEGQGNWNTVLNEIEVKARGVGKGIHGKEAEQWAAEAGTHLRFIKNAWRNHAMHPLEKYDEERAVTIFDNARSFMQHLAGRLGE